MELKNKKRIKFAASLAAVAAASAVAVFTLGGFSGPPAGGPPAANAQAGANGGGKKSAAQAAITVNVTYPERETLSRQTDFAGRIEAVVKSTNSATADGKTLAMDSLKRVEATIVTE